MPLFKIMAKDKGTVGDGSTHREWEDGRSNPARTGTWTTASVNWPIETLEQV